MHTRNLRHRRGVLILAVLAGLALAASLLAVWLKLLALERQEVRGQQVRMQAEYLAAAALSRAETRLATDPDYTGETWQVPADVLLTSTAAEVTIAVQSPDDDPRARRIEVSAHLAGAGPAQTVRSQHRQITLPEEQTP